MGYRLWPREELLNRLAAADRVRYARADLKDDVHADPTWGTLLAVIAGAREPDLVAGMRVLDALLAAPALGPEKAKRLLLIAEGAAGGNRGFDPLIRFDRLTLPRRRVLVHELRLMRARLDDRYVGRLAASPRGSRSAVRETVMRAWAEHAA